MQEAASRLAMAAGLRPLTLRGWVPPAIWMRLPVDRQFRVPVRPGRGFEYRPVAGDQLARPLFWRGLKGKERESIGVFVNLAARARTFCDVGANTGLYTLSALAANPHVHVRAFEPVERVAVRLEDNLQLNEWTDRCTVYRIALAARDGEGIIRVPARAVPMSAHLVGTPERAGAVGLETVEIARLDDVLDPDEPVDLVKIDVEGGELGVLQGMPRTLERWHPTLFVECLPEAPLDDLRALLDDAGYSFAHLRRAGRVYRDRLVADPERRDRNYLCVHPEGRLQP